MSCYGCAEKFGFLKKEYGCPKCGFAYCKKCLRFQMMDPKTSKQLQVCTRCHQAACPPKEPMSVLHALHRLESMDDPAKPPITVYQQSVRQRGFQELRKGLSVEDQRILERLESLKKDDSEHLNKSRRKSSDKAEDEIAQRLARLKGEEYRPEGPSQASLWKNAKPQTEEDVIAKFAAEVELDRNYETSLTQDIEERIAKLRGESNPTQRDKSGTSSALMEDQDELSEEDQVKLILKKFQEEVLLEKKLGDDTDMDVDHSPGTTNNEIEPEAAESDDDIDVDELCGICSEKRATLICEECDDDIYCKACFQELHRDLGEVHAPKVFKKK